MKWKSKNDLCGVPGKGFIKAEDFSEADEQALIQRAKNRGIDVNLFMLNAGFIPVQGPQLSIPIEEELEEIELPEEKPKRKRRTKAEMEAEEIE